MKRLSEAKSASWCHGRDLNPQSRRERDFESRAYTIPPPWHVGSLYCRVVCFKTLFCNDLATVQRALYSVFMNTPESTPPVRFHDMDEYIMHTVEEDGMTFYLDRNKNLTAAMEEVKRRLDIAGFTGELSFVEQSVPVLVSSQKEAQ